MTAPLILIHYGNSSYLPYVIRVARRFNPGQRIIFLGDQSNAYLASLGVDHHPLEPLSQGELLQRFDRLYPRIVNPAYPKSRWAKFVLQRWFMINTFIQQQGIEQFWTFDSDNFIVSDLARHEERFAVYDCTSQCSGRCINGFVANAPMVDRYVRKINQLLADDRYVEQWHVRYREEPSLFYNEMEAFVVFRDIEDINSYHMAQIHEGTMFDDSITYANGMELYDGTIKGRRVKKLYVHNGNVYCKHSASGQLIRMNNLNLSWMPKYVFPALFKELVEERPSERLREIDLLRAPWSYHVKLLIRDRIPRPIRDRLSRGAYWV